MRCLTRWRSWMSHRVGWVGESGEEPFEVLGELDVGLGVVQLGVERVQLGDSAQLGHPPAQLFERDELLLVGLHQSGAGRFTRTRRRGCRGGVRRGGLTRRVGVDGRQVISATKRWWRNWGGGDP